MKQQLKRNIKDLCEFPVSATLLKTMSAVASHHSYDARVYKSRLDTSVAHLLTGDFGVPVEIIAFAIERCFTIYSMLPFRDYFARLLYNYFNLFHLNILYFVVDDDFPSDQLLADCVLQLNADCCETGLNAIEFIEQIKYLLQAQTWSNTTVAIGSMNRTQSSLLQRVQGPHTTASTEHAIRLQSSAIQREQTSATTTETGSSAIRLQSSLITPSANTTSLVETATYRTNIGLHNDVSLSYLVDPDLYHTTPSTVSTLSISLQHENVALRRRIIDETMCVACGEHTRTVLCMPCLHLVYCSSCARLQRFCRLCNRSIIRLQNVFTP